MGLNLRGLVCMHRMTSRPRYCSYHGLQKYFKRKIIIFPIHIHNGASMIFEQTHVRATSVLVLSLWIVFQENLQSPLLSFESYQMFKAKVKYYFLQGAFLILRYWPMSVLVCLSCYNNNAIDYVAYQQHKFISDSSTGYKSKFRVPAWSQSGEGPLQGFRLLICGEEQREKAKCLRLL